MPQHVLRIDNIHCESCESEIQRIVAEQDPRAQARFLQNREIVCIETELEIDINDTVENLRSRGFHVKSANREPIVFTASTSPPSSSTHWLPSLKTLFGRGVPSQAKRKQLEAENTNKSGISDQVNQGLSAQGSSSQSDQQDSTTNSAQAGQLERTDQADQADQADISDRQSELDAFRAVYSVEGMSCASCSQSVVKAVKEALPDVLDVSADTLNGVAHVLLTSQDDINTATKAINEAGFVATLNELLPLSATSIKEFKLIAAVRGMTCASCSNSVKNALDQLDFVSRCNVDVLDGRAEIYTKSKKGKSEIITAVEDLGYEIEIVEDFTEIHTAQAQQRSRTITLRVGGIYCDRCPKRIMDALRTYGDAVDILDAVSVNEPYVKFTYLPLPPTLTAVAILDRLSEANPNLTFEAVRPKSLEEIAAENRFSEKRAISVRLMLTSLISIPTALIMFNSKVMMNFWLMFLLATPIYFFAADIFHKRAIKEIRSVLKSSAPWKQRALHFGSMNLLMSLGTSISYWSSVFVGVASGAHHEETYFDSVIFLTFFLLVGRYLDIYSKIKTTSAISLVSKVRPNTVMLATGENTEPSAKTREISVDLVEVGDVVVIFPGQSSAVDGVVQHGSAEFNESMLTGESLPVPKTKGDEVYAGTLNAGRHSVTLKVSAVGKGTFLNEIVDAVRQGQMQRAPIERYVEQVTSIFVPLVVYLALSVWVIWYFISRDVLWSMQFAISTFVVACPCGIGLAAPTALFIGIGLTAKYGILARGGGEAFQEGANVQVVCFDKTGTITTGGDLTISDSYGEENYEAVQLAASLENGSTHPLAAAVIKYAQGRKTTGARCESIEQIEDKGRGVTAKVTGGHYKGKVAVLGNERIVTEVANCEISEEQRTLLTKWKEGGNSVIVLAISGEGVILMLAVADQIRPESKEVVQHLHDQNIECWLISGDNQQTAKAVARQVGIPPHRVISEVLPKQKSDKIKELQMTAGTSQFRYGRAIVGMVGDGINDAPALAQSDIGIALGRGADIALSSAQFVLLRDDLRGIPTLFEVSKVVMFKVKMNFFWAGIYNAIAIPLAAGVFYHWTHTRLDPVWASLAMALSSVSVMISSLLLRRFKPSNIG